MSTVVDTQKKRTDVTPQVDCCCGCLESADYLLMMCKMGGVARRRKGKADSHIIGSAATVKQVDGVETFETSSNSVSCLTCFRSSHVESTTHILNNLERKSDQQICFFECLILK